MNKILIASQQPNEPVITGQHYIENGSQDNQWAIAITERWYETAYERIYWLCEVMAASDLHYWVKEWGGIQTYSRVEETQEENGGRHFTIRRKPLHYSVINTATQQAQLVGKLSCTRVWCWSGGARCGRDVIGISNCSFMYSLATPPWWTDEQRQQKNKRKLKEAIWVTNISHVLVHAIFDEDTNIIDIYQSQWLYTCT